MGPTDTAAAVGIDVSKDTLDACRLASDGTTRQRVFANAPAGFVALIAWVDRSAEGHSRHFGMEATGPSSHGLAVYLHAAGRRVSVVNPTRIRHAGLMRGRGNKTDAADARLIAEYTLRERPPAWCPPPPEVLDLQALTRRAADRALLETVPGIGRPTATAVLAELPAVDKRPSAQSAAASCGLAPREFRSGSSVKRRTRRSKAGNARLRKALFLPTQTAVRFNPLLAGVFQRPVDAGKPEMQAIGACMRKLVVICYGVLKNRAPFDPSWSSRIAT